jgi:hypothetical protein
MTGLLLLSHIAKKGRTVQEWRISEEAWMLSQAILLRGSDALHIAVARDNVSGGAQPFHQATKKASEESMLLPVDFLFNHTWPCPSARPSSCSGRSPWSVASACSTTPTVLSGMAGTPFSAPPCPRRRPALNAPSSSCEWVGRWRTGRRRWLRGHQLAGFNSLQISP